ncbi:5-hydroxytryptamine receptor 1B-like [Lineus longissimus]|uniref:5-hydroxytryptamine receptor 1B-like n=1 Tax=Lineus longissimus TaxID=88925 RepID=UPI00315D3597
MSDGYAIWNGSYNESIEVFLNQSLGGADDFTSHTLIRNIIVGFLLICIAIASFFGNLLVVCAICSNRRLRTVTNYFVISLAMADLLVSVLVMPFHIVVELTQRWWFGFVICDIWISLDVMFCTASILNLCCISVDRYFAITRPLIYATRRSKKLALIMITVVWIVSIAVTCPPIFGWQEEGRWDDESACALTKDPGYIIYSSLGSFYVPMIIMLFVYAKIFQVTREREIRLKPYRRSVLMASRAYDTNMEDMSLSETKCSSGDNEVSGNSSSEKEDSHPTVVQQASLKSNLSSSEQGGLNEIEETGLELPEHAALNQQRSIDSNLSLSQPGNLNQQSSLKSCLSSSRDTSLKSCLYSKAPATANLPGSNNVHVSVHSPPMRRHQGYTVEFTLNSNHTTSKSQSSLTFPSRNNYQSCLKARQQGSLRINYGNTANKTDKSKMDSKKLRAVIAKERKAAKTLAIVVGAFIFCWLPFFMVYVIEPFCQTCYFPVLVLTGVTWLGYLNSTVNPFIYAFGNRDFRRAYWKLTCGKIQKWRNKSKNRDFNIRR